jgi:DNA-binding transcriptional regulator YiaG
MEKLPLTRLLTLIGCTDSLLKEETDKYEYSSTEPSSLFPATFNVVCGSRHVKGTISFSNGKYQSIIEESEGFNLKRKKGPYVYIMSVPEICERYHISVKELSERFYIPYRTVQNWSYELGFNARKCPEYIRRMMIEILERGQSPL